MKCKLFEKEGKLAAIYELEGKSVKDELLYAVEKAYKFEREKREDEEIPEKYLVKLPEEYEIKAAYEQKATPPIRSEQELYKRIKSDAHSEIFDRELELDEKMQKLKKSLQDEDYKKSGQFLWFLGFAGLWFGLLGFAAGIGIGELLRRKFVIPSTKKMQDKEMKRCKIKVDEYEQKQRLLHQMELY